jgi:hypothetical protein
MDIYDLVFYGVWIFFGLTMYGFGFFIGIKDEKERQEKLNSRLARLRAEQGSTGKEYR